MISMWRWAAAGGLLASLALVAAARADDDPWRANGNWLYVRGGYAKSDANGAANGGAGYGFGFRHMLTPSKLDQWALLGRRPFHPLHWTLFKSWSFGGFVEYDVLGSYGSAREVEIPAALELTRHIMWKSAAHPYMTIGAGPFYRKTYGTGDDFGRVALTAFFASGFDAPVGSHQLLGIDVRAALVDSENKPINPVFGSGGNVHSIFYDKNGQQLIEVRNAQAIHWSLKLSYAVAY